MDFLTQWKIAILAKKTVGITEKSIRLPVCQTVRLKPNGMGKL